MILVMMQFYITATIKDGKGEWYVYEVRKQKQRQKIMSNLWRPIKTVP